MASLEVTGGDVRGDLTMHLKGSLLRRGLKDGAAGRGVIYEGCGVTVSRCDGVGPDPVC
jgi:hypothetical protein